MIRAHRNHQLGGSENFARQRAPLVRAHVEPFLQQIIAHVGAHHMRVVVDAGGCHRDGALRAELAAQRVLGGQAAEDVAGADEEHHYRRSFTNSQTRGGESGSARGSTPSGASAAATAFATTPPTGTMPPSPAPLAPSGLFGEGEFSVMIARMLGKSSAPGRR